MTREPTRCSAPVLLLAALSLPISTWASGAHSAYGIGLRHALAVSEASHAFGEDPPPSPQELERRHQAMVGALSRIHAAVERWIGNELRRKTLALAPMHITAPLISTVQRDHSRLIPGRAVVMPLDPCRIETRNLSLKVWLSLRALPPRRELARLGKELCQGLTASLAREVEPRQAELLHLLPGERQLTPRGTFRTTDRTYAPASLFQRLKKERKAVFTKAVTACSRALRELEQRPGWQLRVQRLAPSRPQAGRTTIPIFYSTHSHSIELELRASGTVAEGVSAQQVSTAMTNHLYAAWSRAGLPRAVSLETLLEEEARRRSGHTSTPDR